MTSLIAFRALQGLGAGAVQPIGMTIVGDIYSVEERAKVQGYLASVWALSAVVGPTLGGVFSDYLSWRWIFFVNLPIGSPRPWMFWRRLRGAGRAPPHRIDSPASVLLTGGGVLLLLAPARGRRPLVVDVADQHRALRRRRGAAGRRSSLVERRAAEPVLPAWVFRHRVILAGDADLAGRRRAADRPDVVRPALRAERARPRRGRRPGFALAALDARLAARGVELRAGST